MQVSCTLCHEGPIEVQDRAYQQSLTCTSPLFPWTRGQALGVVLHMRSETLADTPARADLGAHVPWHRKGQDPPQETCTGTNSESGKKDSFDFFCDTSSFGSNQQR